MVIPLLPAPLTESSSSSHYETHECKVRDRKVGFPEGVASTSREPEQGRRCTPLCQRLSSPLRGQRICHSMVCVPSFTASAVPRQKVCVQPRGEKVCVIQLDSPSYNFSCHSLGSCACLSLGA